MWAAVSVCSAPFPSCGSARVSKDPRDIMFLFAALGASIGCGVNAWAIAAGGTFAFCVIAFILSRSGLSTKNFFDGILRFTMP